jgi:hypothetical protein
MERATVSLPPDLLKRLRHMAAERHTSVASIIREAIEEKAAKQGPKSPAGQRPKPTVFGMGDSGHTDTSKLASEGPVPPVSWRS